MRQRDKRLSDYGVPEVDATALYDKCRDPRFTNLLHQCVKEVIPRGNQKAILMALYAGYGYGKILNKTDIELYCTKNDFYAQKRMAAAAFYKALKQRGYWKDGGEGGEDGG